MEVQGGEGREPRLKKLSTGTQQGKRREGKRGVIRFRACIVLLSFISVTVSHARGSQESASDHHKTLHLALLPPSPAPTTPTPHSPTPHPAMPTSPSPHPPTPHPSTPHPPTTRPPTSHPLFTNDHSIFALFYISESLFKA
ncbi:hypothetical protein E2C01_067242 [Portunus trituberculatus]|uniref:Uncharacterized protein n=1 Tax=Portunus trituberculatus TaxID=210409 RepID=A0A5B7HW52_PORTR|nr:hypothetical protein [Portunus trituberculatus]